MAVLGPHVLAAGAIDGLLLLVFAVLGFAMVAGIAAVVLALIQAVLPTEDHSQHPVEQAEPPADLRSGEATGYDP